MLKCGFVDKKAASKLTTQGYSKRYVVLTRTGLRYFSKLIPAGKELTTLARGEIPLVDVEQVTYIATGQVEGRIADGKHFVIDTISRSYTMRCENAEEATQWVTAIVRYASVCFSKHRVTTNPS
jgi:hypothetical protein